LVGGADAVVPALPVNDALKRAKADLITSHVDRTGMVTVQTPQGFRLHVLREAHAATAADAHDDAQIVQDYGRKVVMVPGELTNLKITYEADLALARAIVGQV